MNCKVTGNKLHPKANFSINYIRTSFDSGVQVVLGIRPHLPSLPGRATAYTYVVRRKLPLDNEVTLNRPRRRILKIIDR